MSYVISNDEDTGYFLKRLSDSFWTSALKKMLEH
jgi:hypothetical protein